MFNNKILEIMKRISIILGLLFCSVQVAFSQQLKEVWLENFNGNLPPSGWQAAPNNLWQATSMYFIQDSSTTNPQSYRGEVPHQIGDSSILETPVYDCEIYKYVTLRFSHICKISPNDEARIEYRVHAGGGVMGAWKPIEEADYMGKGTYTEGTGFNATSYAEWNASNIAALPQNSWWKEEMFDMSINADFQLVQFRFVIKHGKIAGTQLSYGWLLENFELSAATYQVAPPTVQLIRPLIKDTVYSAGPWTINAIAKTNTNARMEIPWLKWTTNTGTADSVRMSKVGTGDSLWSGTIGQYVAGTTVTYLVEGKDSLGNTSTVYSEYTVKLVCGSGGGSGGGDFPYTGSAQTAILSPGIYEIECWGAQGAIHDASGTTLQTNLGALGGYSKGRLTVSTTTTVNIYVGGNANHYTGGWNGGGSAVSYAAGGGGASDVRIGGTALGNRIIVAGGGGGARSPALGGGGGGLTGGTGGANGGATGGTGGTQTAGGNNGTPVIAGVDAALGVGSSGTAQGSCGGGGGYYGGGRGGYSSTSAAGGGGGSGYIGGVYSGVTAQFTDADYVEHPVSDGNGFVRITFVSSGSVADCPDYSAAMYSIDLNDTIATSPTAQIPIVVTVKNTGLLPLSSATVSYMINGNHIKDTVVSFAPALPWDFNGQATIGYFTPKAGNFDSLTVWVTLPNGYVDTVTFDDTLSKKTYGIIDVSAEFVTVPQSVVTTTGPHEVSARIKSITGTPPVSVYLYVTDTSEATGVRNNQRLTMQSQGGDIWSVNIPNIAFESDVEYTLEVTDFLGNIVELSGSYYIKYVCATAGGIGGDYTYTGSVQEVRLAAGTYQIECWGADGGSTAWKAGGKGGYSSGILTLNETTLMYISVAEQGKTSSTNPTPSSFGGGGSIVSTNASYLGNGASGGGASDVRVLADNLYNRIVVGGGGGGANSYGNGSATYSADGGHGGGANGESGGTPTGTTYGPGYGGTQTAGGAIGTGATGSTPGTFGFGGDNTTVLVGSGGGGGWYGGGSSYAGGGAGGGSGYVLTATSHKPTGYFSQQANYQMGDPLTCVYNTTNFVSNPDTSGNGYVRITLIAGGDVTCLDHSVSIDEILSPEERNTAGTLMPVTVRIRNKGVLDMDFCYINWTLNGELQTPTVVYRNATGLPEDFTDTITIGHYPVAIDGGTDNIVVWVSLPNGEVDSLIWDDTLSVSSFACPPSTPLMTIGAEGDYPTVNEALKVIRECGASQDITFELKGVFTENVDLTDLTDAMGNYHLTITSADNHPDSAIVRPASGVAFLLNNSDNLTLENITINVADSGRTSGVQFAAACSNVIIRNCKILANPTATEAASSGIYKASATGIVDNIQIMNNEFDGGYAGTYFYAGTAAATPGTNVTIDSNTVTNTYYYGIHTYNISAKSVSYNKIINDGSRTSSATFMGLYMYYGRNGGNVIGNSIHVDNSSITTTLNGLYTYYVDTALIANNEIILNTKATTTSGLYIDYSREVDYFHNSVLVTGTGATQRALYWYVYNSTSYSATVNNNIFVANGSGTTTYAVHLAGTFPTGANMANYRIDNNNYFSSGNLGYATAARVNLATWKSYVTMDMNSINIAPQFVETNYSNLKTANYADMLCNYIAPVNTDKDGNTRNAVTTMGCYESIPPATTNIMLTRLLGFREGLVLGQTDTLKVIVFNTGTTPVSSVNLSYSINENPQIVGGRNFQLSSNLAQWESDTVTFGEITYGYGQTNVKVWLNNVNGGTVDEVKDDDTLTVTNTICDVVLSDSIIISARGNGDYLTMKEAFDKGELCGVGDVILVLDSGVYTENINLTDISDIFGTHSLTFTSITGNPEDVIIRPSSGVAFLLNNSNNITIENITIDVRSATSGVQFAAACSNVIIRNCKILASPTATAVASSGIYKAGSTGLLDNVQIIGNEFEGGCAGVYLYAGTSSTAFGTNITVDSNIVTNTYFSGIFLYYANLNSVSYNQVMVEPIKSCSTTYHGIYMNYARNGRNIIGNRIHIDNSSSTTAVNGLYTFYVDTALIANNEIIINSKATTTSGLYIDYPREVDYFHNSVLVTGTGATQRALYWYTYANTNYSATINNNIFVATGTGTTIYGMHLTANVGAYQNNYRLDYNNYYSSGTNLGYVGTVQANLAAWKSVMTEDSNSVNKSLYFKNLPDNLKLLDYDSLYCDTIPSVLTDITGLSRKVPTVMGCYEEVIFSANAAILEIIGIREGLIGGETDEIKVIVYNEGATPLTSINLGWSIDDTLQIPAEISFDPPLARRQFDTVTIGNLTYSPGYHTLEVFVNDLDQGALLDEDSTDNTLSASYYVCDGMFSGNIPIGSTREFSTINEALSSLPVCEVGGDITFILDSGVYIENIDLTNISDLFKNYSLTITSYNDNAEDVIIQPEAGVAFLLNNSHNIILENITIDATKGTYGVQSTGATSNITINNCIILADPTATATGKAPIYKATSTGALDNMTIKNCVLDGGYHGIYLNGATSLYYQNITIDSNIVSNQHYYGLYLYYFYKNSTSYNYVTPRDSNQGVTWYGIYGYYLNASNMIGNRIHADNSGITTTLRGMHLYYPDSSSLVANNEIILNSAATTTDGIYMDYPRSVSFYHNTVYSKKSGTTGTNRAHYNYINNVNERLTVKNNIFIAEGGAAGTTYAFYIGGTLANQTSGGTILDYNDYYSSGTNLGYVGGAARTNLSAWKSIMKTDANSVDILPTFVNSTMLAPVDYTGLLCKRSPLISMDIRGNSRGIRTTTTMGCYEGNLVLDKNASLVEILDITPDVIQGDRDIPSIVFSNTGLAAIDSVNIEWSVNNVSRGNKTIYYATPLAIDQLDTILLDEIVYVAGTINIKIWINQANDWITGDDFVNDDTLRTSFYVCDAAMAGNIVVSDTSFFKTIKQFVDALPNCPLVGDAVLLLDTGIYAENVVLTNISNYMRGYSLTITSITGDAEDVIIRPASGVAILLNNSDNIILENITIDATKGTYGVQSTGATSNITINNCIILADPTATATGKAPIYKAASTGALDNIIIKNCVLDGGYHGIYLNGATSLYYQNITIDSNIISNQYYYGAYLYYVNQNSVSYNHVTAPDSNQGTTWYGLWFNYARNGGNIIGNRIYADNSGISSTLYGMRTYYTDTALVANNEIYLKSSASTTYGIYIDYSRAVDYLHNTVLLTGTGGATFRAIGAYTYNNASYDYVIKNNIFVANGGTTPYAIYQLGTYPSSYLSLYQIDWNNYYSSGSLGYGNGAARADLAAWKTNVGVDSNSVNQLPDFKNLPNDLELSDYTGLSCPLLPLVTEDITGYERIKSATMGCYQIIRFDKDAMAANIVGVEDGVAPNQTHYVDAVIQNMGFDTLTSVDLEWFIDGISMGTVTPTISTALDEYATIPLGAIPLPYTIGDHTIKVVVNGVNGGLDENPVNDTIEMVYFSCTGTVSGDVRVGTSNEADYSDITTIINRIKTCGISGKVTIFLENGTFTKSLDLSPIIATSNDTIELVSLSGNADSVIIATSTFGIKTGDLDNIYIKNITINLRGEGYGILLGGGDNIEINGCIINLDTTIAKNMTGSNIGSRHVAIYKPEDAGISNYGRILNNIVTGGYNTIMIYAGDVNTYGTNWIYDSNTVQKAYYHSIYMYYTDFLSMSYNTSKPMTNATNNTTSWRGFTVQSCNVEIIQGNRIHGQGYTFANPVGMFFHNLNANTAPAKIFNNEIILSRSGTSTDNAFIFNTSSGNIYHNSIYVKDAASSTYASLYVNTDKITDVRNNNLIATKSPAVVIWSNVTTLDYNNYYTEGDAIGAYNGSTVTGNIDSWKSISSQDVHSVSVFPTFSDLSQSMEVVDSFAYIGCPVFPDVTTDINNTVRQYAITAMGAYELIPADTLMIKHTLRNFPEEAIVNQRIPVEVEIANFSTLTVDSVLLAYSYNEGSPAYYLWKSTSSLATLTSVMVDIDTIDMSSDVELRIWIAEINGIATMNALTDTISAILKLIPLAEFTAPTGNTIAKLSFDVHAKISTITGAPLTSPVLQVKSELNSYLYQDNIPMTLSNGEWVATIPPQYYGCKVTYSIIDISDMIGNKVTIIDSIQIIPGGAADSVVVIGTGTSTLGTNPYAYNYNYSWSRNYYMAYEIDPEMRGGMITSIAFYNTSTASSNVDNVSFYLKAVSDSVNVSTAYIDPIVDGATLVWGSATANTGGVVGWLTFELNTPFDLPPGMNLLVYCNDEDGSYSGNGSATFQYTAQGKNTSVYVYSDTGPFPPSTTANMNGNRPNIRIAKETFDAYIGHDLGIVSVLSPVFNPEEPCEVAYSPVQVVLTNLGNQDYDFSKDSVTIEYEIIDPDQLTYNGILSLDTGELRSGREMIIELLSNFPIIAGTSSVRAWVISSVDDISYDDTIFHTYVSQKIGLPVDEYFSSTILPSEFTATPDDANGWQPYHPAAGFPVQPDSAGTGVLRYAGAMGTMATLSTSRQLDLYGTISPKLEFWYYHDSTLSESDNSYTDVNITVDGVFETVLYLLKRSKIHHGWTQYIVDLASYTTAQCVLLEFESMNKSNQTVQYIDRIFITSDQDLAVLDILISPEIKACELANKSVSVVIATATNHSIDFLQYPTSLALEVPGYATIYHPLQGSMHGHTSDTVLVASDIDLAVGSNQIKAYLIVPVDNNDLNDVIEKVIDITPKFEIAIQTISTDTDAGRASAGFKNYQVIIIENTGNMDLPEIELILSVNLPGAASHFVTTMTTDRNLSPGQKDTISFDSAYIVPWSFTYEVMVHGYLLCDSTNVNAKDSELEYVDTEDLALIEIVKPEDDQTIDIVDSQMEVSIKIENKSLSKVYYPGDVKIGYMITRLDGTPESPYSGGEINASIAIGDTIPFNFGTAYTVPKLEEYYLVVYIEEIDKYNQNDTLKMFRKTNHVGVSNINKVSFTMEQNIPNPAKGNTIINYSIPQDGEILFNVYSVSGQLLFTKQENVPLGEHQIELNLSDYASGIYFYTMEYKGQRISKLMSIER
jgi:hypothetical protein